VAPNVDLTKPPGYKKEDDPKAMLQERMRLDREQGLSSIA